MMAKAATLRTIGFAAALAAAATAFPAAAQPTLPELAPLSVAAGLPALDDMR